MANGLGISAQTRLRPVTSQAAAAGASNGVGVNYGFGVGSVRIAGVTYSVLDAAQLYDINSLAFLARIVIINGDYPPSAQLFTVFTDLTQYDVLFDAVISDTAQATQLSTAQSGMITDDGLNATAMISQLFFVNGAPVGIQPVSKLILHADHYKTRALALSPGAD
jgi:hypothetical protein